MRPLNIYITGVGGQGIGLLSEVLTRAAVLAGYRTIGSDTHGLAQRGGSVSSHLRFGKGPLFGPLIPAGSADLVVGLERLEALRGTNEMLRPGGHLFYCDAQYAPIAVRMAAATYPEIEDVSEAAARKGATVARLDVTDLPDPKLQNTALLGRLIHSGVLQGISAEHVLAALETVLPPRLFEINREVFLTHTSPADPDQ